MQNVPYFFIVILMLPISIFAFSENKKLFTAEDIKKLEYLKSNEFLIKKNNDENQNNGKKVFKYAIKAQKEAILKDLKKKQNKAFEAWERKYLYENMYKRFLKE